MSYVDRVRHRYIDRPHAKRLIENNIVLMDNAITCLVEIDTQNVATGTTPTTMSFDTELWDTDSMWAIGDPTKVYANRDGLYLIGVYVDFGADATASTIREHRILENGARNSYYEHRTENNNDDYYTWARAIMLSAGDYLTMDLLQTSGSTLACIARLSLSRIAK